MNLPEPKRLALAAFYAGRISAGELSRRLTPATENAPRPEAPRLNDRAAITPAQARG